MLLVPKLYLGTHLRAQLYCGGGEWCFDALVSPLQATELPGQARSIPKHIPKIDLQPSHHPFQSAQSDRLLTVLQPE